MLHVKITKIGSFAQDVEIKENITFFETYYTRGSD